MYLYPHSLTNAFKLWTKALFPFKDLTKGDYKSTAPFLSSYPTVFALMISTYTIKRGLKIGQRTSDRKKNEIMR